MNQAERSLCLKEARTPAGLKGKLSSLQKVTQSQFRKLVSLNISLELKHFFCYYYYCFCCCIWGIFKDKSAFIHIIMIKPATGNNFLHYLFFLFPVLLLLFLFFNNICWTVLAAVKLQPMWVYLQFKLKFPVFIYTSV